MDHPPPDRPDGRRPPGESSGDDVQYEKLRRRYLEDRGPGPIAMAGAGLELTGVVLTLTLGGWWVDTTLNTLPWFVITGLMIGMIGGLYNMWRRGRRFFGSQNHH